ncbi:MAG: hypothetical protein ABJH45_21710 [Paracoccaceae bacterium]
MKDSFLPLVLAMFFLFGAAIFWYQDFSKGIESERLAAEVEVFLENHRQVSSDHSLAYQNARELQLLAQSPNRAVLAIFSLLLAVQFLSSFFGNSKGRAVRQKLSALWQWRP